MEEKIRGRHLLWSSTKLWKERCTNPQSREWSCLPTVSCKPRWHIQVHRWAPRSTVDQQSRFGCQAKWKGKVKPQKQKRKRQAKVGSLREGALKKRKLADWIDKSERNRVEATLEANADTSVDEVIDYQSNKLPSNEVIQTKQTQKMPSMGS